MPFNWQPNGALRGTTPNQLSGMGQMPQNAEGLGVGGGQVMFNLPRYQMPGTEVGFGGDIQPGGGAQQGGQPTSLKFSVNRIASSDPVKNIINDIQNPLGGLSVNFGGGGPAEAPARSKRPDIGLRDSMMGMGQSQGLMNEMNMGGPTPNFNNYNNPMAGPMEGFSIGTPGFENLAKSQFALKQRMVSPSLMGTIFTG